MLGDEIKALKEDIHVLQMKCEELSRLLGIEVEKNHKLILRAEKAEDDLCLANQKNDFLRGKVEALEFAICKGKV